MANSTLHTSKTNIWTWKKNSSIHCQKEITKLDRSRITDLIIKNKESKIHRSSTIDIPSWVDAASSSVTPSTNLEGTILLKSRSGYDFSISLSSQPHQQPDPLVQEQRGSHLANSPTHSYENRGASKFSSTVISILGLGADANDKSDSLGTDEAAA